jgi:hypothetical protein
VIGYYNGAEISFLDDQSIPSSSTELCEELKPIADLLKQHSELTEVARITERKFQITLEPSRSVPDNLLWDMVHQILVIGSKGGFRTVSSSHSIDILAHSATKINVINRIKEICGSATSILKIGDRGRWPGNDFALLQEPLSLSVDEISVDPKTCWNLAPRGQRGVAVTVEYLRAMKEFGNGSKIRFSI